MLEILDTQFLHFYNRARYKDKVVLAMQILSANDCLGFLWILRDQSIFKRVSFNTFVHFMERDSNAKFLIRVKQNNLAMREIAKLPMTKLDTNISFTVTTTQTKADKANGYIFVQTRKKADRAYFNSCTCFISLVKNSAIALEEFGFLSSAIIIISSEFCIF